MDTCCDQAVLRSTATARIVRPARRAPVMKFVPTPAAKAMPGHELLPDGGVRRVARQRGMVRVSCGSGLLWVTQFDDSRDVIVRPGESVEMDARRDVIVQALKDSQFRVQLLPNDS